MDASLASTMATVVEVTFTHEQQERFQMRYEEGYEFYDPTYASWLEMHKNLPPDHKTLSPHTDPPLSSPDVADRLKTTPPTNITLRTCTSHPQNSPSPLSSYLPPVTPPSHIKTGKARVLPSSECLAILQKKEHKKKA